VGVLGHNVGSVNMNSTYLFYDKHQIFIQTWNGG